MYTLGHAAINLAMIGSFGDRSAGYAVLAGAILPDVPIAILYIRERARGMPVDAIWRGPYQQRFWQNCIHGIHSIPLAVLGLAVAVVSRSPIVLAFFASMLLHLIVDFFVHAEDAHRQFLPFSQYRFISPISYWDVRHHGRLIALLEGLAVFVSTGFLWLRTESWVERGALVLVDVWYLVNYWRSFLRRV